MGIPSPEKRVQIAPNQQFTDSLNHPQFTESQYSQTSEIIRPEPQHASAPSPLKSALVSGFSDYSGIYGSELPEGAVLPIVLPSKLQWCRDTHRRLSGADRLSVSKSLSELGIRSLPSELFFGRHEQGDRRLGGDGYQMITRLGPQGEDGFMARSTVKERIRKDNLHNYSKHYKDSYSFDRIGKFRQGI